MNNLISVIVPTFKRPDRLLRALKSVFSQTCQEFEILVIDDDPLENHLEELLKGLEDDRIRLFKNERKKGANGARNFGILNSKGKFLAFLDDDDEWLPDYLQSQRDILQKSNNSYGLVHADYYFEENQLWKKKHQSYQGNILAPLITDRFRIGSGSNIFIKSSVIKTTGLWDEEMKRQQDLEFLVRVLSNFMACSNSIVGLKVYGHNDPSPEKTFETREFYVHKIQPYLNLISEKEQNLFFSNHYRRQANYLVKMKAYKKAILYWNKAAKYKTFVPRKDGKILISLVRSL
ncbi:glycosyltransferase family 2 protein [Lutimonas vermicola]|uniref:Glycosyltransferase family 2 protein n=1 Tax=Lutimonas vermicola TaxID=414288 RepID=A0ABU9L386_9FLAO